MVPFCFSSALLQLGHTPPCYLLLCLCRRSSNDSDHVGPGLECMLSFSFKQLAQDAQEDTLDTCIPKSFHEKG